MKKTLAVMVGAGILLYAFVAQANLLTQFNTVLNTDFTTAGTGGMRNTGTGTITVSGVTGPVSQSYLFWHGPTSSSDPNANANVTVNGAPVTGTNIGFSSDNIWGFQNSQAYRANTTSVINGNGAYNLSNFVKPPNVQANGAATAIFYNDGNAANNRDVIIFNGNDSNVASSFDPAGWSVTLNGINYAGGTATITAFVSDGQNFGPTDDGTIRLNGAPLVTGGIFQGDTLPGGAGLTGNGNLFDIRTFDITSFLTPGINNLTATLDGPSVDALSLVALFVDLPAGAAPSTIPEPGTIALVGIGLAGLLRARKFKRA